MPAAGREPSMEDILASIKRVIAEEKELRTAARPSEPLIEDAVAEEMSEEEDVLELDQPVEPLPPVDLGPPLVDESAAEKSRHALEALSSIAATAPPQPQVNPLEEMIREMLRPILKQWLDDNLPKIVEEHVKREISRITGRPL
jgi:cell pole-organizing protein PopZ